jgi:hypothetical protein
MAERRPLFHKLPFAVNSGGIQRAVEDFHKAIRLGLDYDEA